MSKQNHKKSTPPAAPTISHAASSEQKSAPTTPTTPTTPSTPLVSDGQITFHGALVTLSPRMQTIPKELLVSTRTDIEISAIKILARSTSLRGEVSRLAALPEFDSACVENAILASSACLELVTQLRTADVQSSEAKLEPWLLTEATERKGRMLRNAAHYFESDPIHGPEIADIRHGTAHTNLASALMRLAVLYANPQIAAIVSKDPMFYDPQDESRARVLAETIYKQLGEPKNTADQQLATQLSQAWTILSGAWDQIRRAVAFFYWGDADKIAEFPPLFALGRGARSASKGATDPDAETPKEEPAVAAV